MLGIGEEAEGRGAIIEDRVLTHITHYLVDMNKNKGFAPLAIIGIIALVILVAYGGTLLQQGASDNSLAGAGGAFDQFGYNDKARIFNGAADGVDRKLDGMVWGDPTYANDHLTMKWNAAWDACNAHGYDDPTYCLGAWVDNEWNGAAPGGSSEVWHYKIIWVGSSGTASQYWQPGGYSVWGNYEVLMDQGVTLNDGPVHTFFANATPNGYGSAKK